MAELITLEERNNDVLRNKLGDLFVSMERNLSVQTNTLSNMYKLQVTESAYTREKDKDAAREKLTAIKESAQEEASPEAQTPEVQEKKQESMFASALLQGLRGVLSSLSLKGLLRLPFRVLMASFLERAVEKALTEMDVDPAFADSIGNGVWWATLGSAFGWRVAAIFGLGRLGYDGGAAIARWFNDTEMAKGLGLVLNEEWSGMVGAAIGGIIALILPGLIMTAVRGAIARIGVGAATTAILGALGLGANAATGAAGDVNGRNSRAGRLGILDQLTDEEIRNKGFVREGPGQYRAAGGDAARAARNAAGLMQDAGSYISNNNLGQFADDVASARATSAGLTAGSKALSMLMRGLIAAGFAYSAYRVYTIYNDTEMNPAQKTEAISGEVGGLLGGIGGAALAGALMAAFGTSVGPWGTAAGLLAGGVAGAFAGEWLSEQVAGAVMGTGGDAPVPSGMFMEDPYNAPLINSQGGLIDEQIDGMPTWSEEILRDYPMAANAAAPGQQEWIDANSMLYNADGSLKPDYQLRYDRMRVHRQNTASDSALIALANRQTSPQVPASEPAPAEVGARNLENVDALVDRMTQNYLATLGRAQPVLIQGGSVVAPSSVDARSSTTIINQTVDQSGALANNVLPWR